MAKLPSALDLQRRPAPSESPGISVGSIDYGPMAKGANAIGEGMQAVGKGVSAYLKAGEEVDDYETKKRLLDFRLDSEMALENAKRDMLPGGGNFAESWQKTYEKQAKQFVGKDDSAIPSSQRAKVGLLLKQHEVALSERAQRYELTERDKAGIESLELTLGKTRDYIATKPEERDKWLSEGHGVIDQSRLPITDKYRLKQKFTKEVDKAYGESLVNSIQSADDLEKVRDLIAPTAPDRGAERAQLRGIDNRESGGPASVRYNNPGAMYPGPSSKKFGAVETKIIGGGHKIAVFPDAVSGAAAQFDLMDRSYTGMTLRGAVAKWSGGNSPGTYAAVIERETGISANTVLTKEMLSDPAIAIPIAKAMAVQEAGKPYPMDDAAWQSAHSLYKTGGKGGVAPAGEAANDNPDAYRGPMQSLSLDERRGMWGRAEKRFREMVGDTEKLIKEQMSVAGDGYIPPKQVLDVLEERVGKLKDPMLAAQYATMLGKAEVTGRLQKAPPLAIEELARRERESLDVNGATKEQLEAVKHVEKLAGSIRKNVNENPLAWAQKTGITVPLADGPPDDLDPGQRGKWKMPVADVKLEQLNFGADDIDAQLGRRAEQAKGVGRYYSQPPQMFTTNEREFLKDKLRDGGPVMLHILGKVAKAASAAGIDPTIPMREFSKDPEVAMIGLMVAEGANPRLLDEAAKSMHLRKQEGDKFINQIDKAQTKPDVSDLMPTLKATPGMIDPVVRTANNVYEYRHRQQGKTSFDADLYRSTVREILGETKIGDVAYGGPGKQGSGWMDGKWSAPVIVPNGVRQDSFDDLVGALRQDDLQLTGQPMSRDGKPLSIAKVRQATWVSVGNGRYGLQFDTDPDGSAVMALDQSGKPFVMDLRPVMQNLKKRKPEIFSDYRPQ